MEEKREDGDSCGGKRERKRTAARVCVFVDVGRGSEVEFGGDDEG